MYAVQREYIAILVLHIDNNLACYLVTGVWFLKFHQVDALKRYFRKQQKRINLIWNHKHQMQQFDEKKSLNIRNRVNHESEK